MATATMNTTPANNWHVNIMNRESSGAALVDITEIPAKGEDSETRLDIRISWPGRRESRHQFPLSRLDNAERWLKEQGVQFTGSITKTPIPAAPPKPKEPPAPPKIPPRRRPAPAPAASGGCWLVAVANNWQQDRRKPILEARRLTAAGISITRLSLRWHWLDCDHTDEVAAVYDATSDHGAECWLRERGVHLSEAGLSAVAKD